MKYPQKIKVGFFHPNLMDSRSGSTELLFRDIIFNFRKKNDLEVHAIYGIERKRIDFYPTSFVKNVKYHKFVFSNSSSGYNHKILEANPPYADLISRLDLDVLFCFCATWGQNSIKQMQKGLPIILISPFGHFASNGNVRKLYVSGKLNVKNLYRLGLYQAEEFYNPINIPIFNKAKFKRQSESKGILFGRTGRPDESTFDPISLKAFNLLRKKYGNIVRFLYVNPSACARDFVYKNKIDGVDFCEWLSREELRDFYNKIDVFAHSRLDGETLGVAIAEAMLHQNPVITHISRQYNEHLNILDLEISCKVTPLDDFITYYKNMEYFLIYKKSLGAFGSSAKKHAEGLFNPNLTYAKIYHDVLFASCYKNKTKGSINNYRIFIIESYRYIRYNFLSFKALFKSLF